MRRWWWFVSLCPSLFLTMVLHTLPRTVETSRRDLTEETFDFIINFLSVSRTAPEDGLKVDKDHVRANSGDGDHFQANSGDEDNVKANSGRGHKIYFTDEELDRGGFYQVVTAENYRHEFNGEKRLQANKGLSDEISDVKDVILNRLDSGSSRSDLDDTDSVEESFQRLMMQLPRMVDKARDEISEDIAKHNMLGYTVCGGLVLGALFDIISYMIKKEMLLWEIFTNETFFWNAVYFWGYAVGFSGPFLFPDTFRSDDPNLACSSRDFFSVLANSDLSLNIDSLASKSEGELFVLTEQIRREFNLNLGCVLTRYSQSSYP
jgi:hypothetical protein